MQTWANQLMLRNLLGRNHLDNEVIDGEIEVTNWYNQLDLPLQTAIVGRDDLLNNGTQLLIKERRRS